MRGGVMKPGRATGPRGLDSNNDPVCGMELKERDPQRSSALDGQLIFFCSRECKERFDSNPGEFRDKLRHA
jgi:YHS domain-containing protein